jgi:hypothetical protein
MDANVALLGAKAESDAKRKKLLARIERAKAIIAVSEAALGRLGAELEVRCQELTREFLNLPVKRERRTVRRHPRGTLDQPMLDLIRAETNGTTTVPEACDLWNQRNPDDRIGRGTMRGVLDRLEAKGRLVIVEEGNRGRSNLRIYRHPDVEVGEDEQAEATAH